MRPTFLFIAGIFSMYSCIDKELNTQLISTEVTSAFEAYVEDINDGNTSNIPEYFTDDTAFYWVEDGLLAYENKQAMIESLEAFTANSSDVSMKIEDLRVTPLTSEVATLYAAYVQEIKFASGFELNLDGAMTIVLGKEGDTWKFLNGHSSIKKERNDLSE